MPRLPYVPGQTFGIELELTVRPSTSAANIREIGTACSNIFAAPAATP